MCVPWCLIRVSSVLGVGVVMHVLHLPDERYVVLIGAARGWGSCVWRSWEGRVQVVSVIEGVVI